ncbi:MAG: DUF4388 domain-containing protein [Pseudomonadota bacterium]
MAPRVLLSLDDVVLASGVAPLLHDAGFDALIVADPGELPARGVDADVVAVVAQDSYIEGYTGADLLQQMLTARGEPVPSILVCHQPPSETERAPLVQRLHVRAFLNSSTTDEALVDAVRRATGGLKASLEFDGGVETMHEGADPFDLFVELSDEVDVDPDSDPHREVTRTVSIDVPEEARGPASNPELTPAQPRVPAMIVDETSIDLNLMTLGLSEVITDEHEIDQGNVQEQEDMAQIEELQRQLAQERAAREKAEAEIPRAQRQAKERVQKLEAALTEARGVASKAGDADAARAKLAEAELKELRKYKDAAERKLRKLEGELREVQGAVPDLAGGMFDDDEAAPSSEGRFEQIPYPRLLGRLLKHRFAGSMSLRTGATTREIFFNEGRPVAYSSASPGERLGQILVEQKRITEQQYMTAARRMVERGVKLTDALLELGYIDTQHLDEEQRFLTRDQIVSGFGVTEGSFTLTASVSPPPDTPRFDFSPGEIYVAGYRQYAPEGEVNALFETMRRLYLKPSEEMAAYRPHLGLEAEDERLLRLLGKAYTTEEAVARANVSEERAARLLGALRGLGLIAAWNPGAPQFEERVRQMQQEYRNEVLTLREELQTREDRVIDTFEKALARLEQGGSALTGASATLRQTVDLPPREEKTEPHFDRSKLQGSKPFQDDTPPAGGELMGGEAEVKSALDYAFIPPASAAPPPPLPPPPPPPKATLPTPTSTKPMTAIPPAPPPTETDTPAEAKFREGMNRAAQGQLDEAEGALREAVRLDAQRPSYLSALARVLLSNPKYDRSGTLPVVRSLLERAQTLAPNDDEVRALLARVSSEQTQLE